MSRTLSNHLGRLERALGLHDDADAVAEDPEEFDTGDPDELIVHHWSPAAKAILQRFYAGHPRGAELIADLEQGYIAPRRQRAYPGREEQQARFFDRHLRDPNRIGRSLEGPQLELSRVDYEVGDEEGGPV